MPGAPSSDALAPSSDALVHLEMKSQERQSSETPEKITRSDPLPQSWF